MKIKLLSILAILILIFYGRRMGTEAILPKYPESIGISIVKDPRKVYINGYKVFNAGVIKEGDGFVFATRKRAESRLKGLWDRHVCKINSKGIAIGELDHTFSQKGGATYYRDGEQVEGLDVQYIDPRLVRVGEDIYMVYCRQINRPTRALSEACLHLAKLVNEGGLWKVATDKKLIFDGAEEFYQKGLVQKGFEKNWMPFSENGRLYFIYLMEPEHVVLESNLETGQLQICSRTENPFKKEVNAPRGSSPAVFDEELGQWITCYHYVFPTTRKITGKQVDAYFFGAYTFSKEAPYTILRRTPGPLMGDGLYNNFHKIIFPTSLVRDGEDYLIFYGDDDVKNKVARISRKELIASMKEVGDD
jgi:predicted GH43/DUF377 family glycosyl hydrolase